MRRNGVIAVLLLTLMLLAVLPQGGVWLVGEASYYFNVSVASDGDSVEMYTGDLGVVSYLGGIPTLYTQSGAEFEDEYYDDDMYSEAFAIFSSPSNNESIAVIPGSVYLRNYTVVEETSDYVIVRSGEGTLSVLGANLSVYREFTVMKSIPLVIVTTVIRHEGGSPISGAEVYEYNDIDLAGASSDYVIVPVNGVPTRLNVETFLPADTMIEPWLIQTDIPNNRSVAVIIGSQELLRGVYFAAYHGEEPPGRVWLNGETITEGDIVFAISWSLSLQPGEEAAYTFAYTSLTTPEKVRELLPLVGALGGVSASLQAPRTVYWGNLFPVTLNLKLYSSDSASYTATISVPGGFQLEDTPASVTGSLQPGEEASTTWYLRAPSSGVGHYKISVTVEYNVTSGGESRSATLTRETVVSLEPSPYRYVIVSAGTLEAPGSLTLNHTVPESIYHVTNLTLSGSPGILYIEGVKDLISFPYGCAEQRTSKLLALIQAYRYLEATGEMNSSLRATMIQYIVEGALSLVDLQHEDGGWGWYPEYESTVFFTAYATLGLSEVLAWADDYGVYLPTSNTGRTVLEAVQAGVNYLEGVQQGGAWTASGPDYIEQANLLTAFTLRALARAAWEGGSVQSTTLTGAASYLQDQMTSSGALPATPGGDPDPYTTAVALEAFNELVRLGYTDYTTTADTLASYLEQAAQGGSGERYWETTTPVWSGAKPSVTATVVRALYGAGHTNMVPDGLSWLLNNSASWVHSTTITTATVLGTINILYEEYNNPTSVQVSVTLNGEQVLSTSIEGGRSVTEQIPTRVGENTITIEATGQGPVAVVVRTVYWTLEPTGPPPVEAPPVETGSMSLSWTFEEENPDGTVTTTLTITVTGTVMYTLLTVPIPAGYTVDPEEIRAQGYAVDSVSPVLTIPIQSLGEGEHTITITLIPVVENPQVETVMNPRAQLMYSPSVEAYGSVDASAIGAEPAIPPGTQPGGGGETATSPSGATSPQGGEENQTTTTQGETGGPTDIIGKLLEDRNTLLLIVVIILLVVIIVKKR